MTGVAEPLAATLVAATVRVPRLARAYRLASVGVRAPRPIAAAALAADLLRQF